MDVDEMKVKANGEQDSKRKSLLKQMILDLLRMEEKAISEISSSHVIRQYYRNNKFGFISVVEESCAIYILVR